MKAIKVEDPNIIVGETGCIQMEEESCVDAKDEQSDKWPIRPSTHLSNLDEPLHPELQVTPMQIVEKSEKSFQKD